MLLLYPFLDKFKGVPYKYLHSIMLLLYRERRCRLDWINWIYIPLCFYFIGHVFHAPKMCLHLHSIMLLLYRLELARQQKWVHYLHSIMLLLYLAFGFLHPSTPYIYIPLCFYFIEMALRLAGAGNQVFTFHYASTLSRKAAWSIMSTMIYIPLCFYFIYFPLRHWRRFCHIYIPLCFYFIAASIWGTHSCVAFTFHYASTLSKAEPNKACTRADLHSIMLLLYRTLV